MMPDNADKSASNARKIRPERSYVEVPAEEVRNLAFPAAAGVSALGALFSIFALVVLTAVFSPLPIMQIVFYCLGTLAAAIAAVSGLVAIFRLRRNVIPRGRFSARFGLVVGTAILAVAINAARPLVAQNADAAVSCKDGQYFIDRPTGWIVLPDNAFDVTSDAEMVKLDGTGFATINRLNKRPPMDGLVNFLSYVCKMPYARVHSHEHGARESAHCAFVPVTVAIAPEHRRELREKIGEEITDIEKRVATLEAKTQTTKTADALLQYRERVAELEKLQQPEAILKREIAAKLGRELEDDFVRFQLAESTATAPGGSPIIEVVFAGRCVNGDACTALALIWFTENKRFQIIAFTSDTANLPALREDMLKAIAGFRVAE